MKLVDKKFYVKPISKKKCISNFEFKVLKGFECTDCYLSWK